MFGKKIGYDIFLGGTTNKSTWRDDFLKIVKNVNPNLKCFNPVVDNWTTECIELENFVKIHCKYHVYVLTPRMIGIYSIAEMVDSVHDASKKVYIYIQPHDKDDAFRTMNWDSRVKNSLNAVSNLIVEHGGYVADSLEDLIAQIDKDYRSTPSSRSNAFRVEDGNKIMNSGL